MSDHAELDRIIAEKLGWTNLVRQEGNENWAERNVWFGVPPDGDARFPVRIPRFHTDPYAALDALERWFALPDAVEVNLQWRANHKRWCGLVWANGNFEGLGDTIAAAAGAALDAWAEAE